MEGYGEGSPYCCFHPNEFVVGVCALCLKERLHALALKQGHHPLRNEGGKLLGAQPRKPGIPNVPKVFVLASLLHLLEPRHSSGQDDGGGDDKEGSIASLEDSFISIKFEDSGRATWEKKTASNVEKFTTTSTDNNGYACTGGSKEGVKTMVELTNRGGGGGGTGALRWRKRISHILQLTRWKRSGKVEGGIKGGRPRGWLRGLTRRSSATATTN